MVTWNCRSGTDTKYASVIEVLSPDLLVMPESSSLQACSTKSRRPLMHGQARDIGRDLAFSALGLIASSYFRLALAAANGLSPASVHRALMAHLWRGSESAGHHLDYVLVPESWKVIDIKVGSYGQWGGSGALVRSDHAPVTVDVLM